MNAAAGWRCPQLQGPGIAGVGASLWSGPWPEGSISKASSFDDGATQSSGYSVMNASGAA
jgi:hypothetical protein